MGFRGHMQQQLFPKCAGTQSLKWDSGHVSNVFQAKTIGYGNNTIISSARDGQVQSTHTAHPGGLMHRTRCELVGRAAAGSKAYPHAYRQTDATKLPHSRLMHTSHRCLVSVSHASCS
jgi:hypothetical protein